MFGGVEILAITLRVIANTSQAYKEPANTERSTKKYHRFENEVRSLYIVRKGNKTTERENEDVLTMGNGTKCTEV